MVWINRSCKRNGIGPESFPEWLRAVGTEESIKASNERFKRNGYKAAKAEFGWWRPRRYLVISHARCNHYSKAMG